MGSRVIVGVGGGSRALAYAMTEARRRGAELHAVRAWRDTGQPGPWSSMRRRQLAHAAMQVLVERVTVALGADIHEVTLRLAAREGGVAEVLLAYADREDDLLVLGSDSDRPLWPVAGSVVRRCLRKSGCPVVVVPVASERLLLRELRRDIRAFARTGGV